MLKIYKASAGSGKTFTLAKEYIRLLLGVKGDDGKLTLNPNPVNAHRSILAITFTNKATDEMKRRIIHELAVLAGAEPGWEEESPYAADLMKEYGCTAHELRKSSRLALQRLLFDFNFFNVSTIDAFFQAILRTFAREAELTSNYELQLEGKDMVAEGVGRLITSLSTDPDTRETRETSKTIIAFMLEQLNDAKGSNLFDKSGGVYSELLKKLARLNDETLALNLDAFSKYISDPGKLEKFKTALTTWRGAVKADAAAECRKVLKIIADCGVERLMVKNFIKALTNEANGEPSKLTYIDKVLDSGVAEVFLKGKYRDDSPVNDAIIAAASAVRERANTEVLINALLAHSFAMQLMRRVMEKMEEYRAENNALLISDTNSLLQSIIGDDDAPFVYERMGVWFNHFLIDEFQDTSRMQWDNLRPLVGEGIAEGNDSLIIGDEKQCIYRFRNSDPTLLGTKVGHDFAGSVLTIGGESSNSNWRSSTEVVDFNNRLFEAMAANNSMTDVYANVKQIIRRTDRHGFVKIKRLEGNDKDSRREETLSLLADDISRQLHAGYKPADIAVLVRKNEEGEAVIDYLLMRQLADEAFPKFGIVSDDAMSLGSSPVVKIIVSALRSYAAHDAADERKPKSRAALERMISRYEHGIGFGLSPADALKRAVESSADAVPEVKLHRTWSLVSLVESIIASEVPEGMYESQNGFISAFMDLVQDFCSRNTAADIQGLLKWWDEQGKKSKVSAPADTTAIRVMTIHKSKGLEFPCVHLPMVYATVVKFLDPEWVSTEGLTVPGADPSVIPPLILITPSPALENTVFGPYVEQRTSEQILDELNTLYVGFTRAVDELCVSYAVDTTQNGDSEKLTEGKLVNDALRSAFGVTLEPGSEYTSGSPTTPHAEKNKKTTALDPHDTGGMKPFYTIHRDDLWKGIEVATDEDEL